MEKKQSQKQDIDIRRKTQSGVTLIALVVTIIVLLILAAVSIGMLTGENGILTNAKDARDKTREANAKEAVQVEVIGSYGTDGNIDMDLLNTNLKRIKGLTHGGKTLNENPITSLPTEVELDGFTIEIHANGNVIIKGLSNVNPGEDNPPVDELDSIVGKKYDTETNIIVDDTPVTVPGGATISGIEEETTIEEGLVAYIIPEGETVDWTNPEDVEKAQETYDQFVWVPVPNAVVVDESGNESTDVSDIDRMIAEEKYPMAIKTDATNYRGILYDFTLTDGKVVVSDRSWSSTSTDYREPAYLTDSSYTDASPYNTVEITQDSLQIEFNTMVQKVATNGGFYVGRYETSHMIGTATTSKEDALNKAPVEADTTNRIKVIKGTTEGISIDDTKLNFINWYRMYAQQKNYAGHAQISLTSSMIWGSQWDQIMIWMRNIQNKSQNSYYVVNAIGMGNYGAISEVNDGYNDTTKPAPTGCFAQKNIYDLAGNVYDWTLEASDTFGRVLRGGGCNAYRY